MPPKKRAKPSTSTSTTNPSTATPSKPSGKDTVANLTSAHAASTPNTAHASAAALDVLNDPWTDDEETSLFKNMIRYKPTGLHKHIHMIQIASSMSREGFSYQGTPSAVTESGQSPGHSSHDHTRIPGIWKKLGELYDLEALDERENAHALAQWPSVVERAGLEGSDGDASVRAGSSANSAAGDTTTGDDAEGHAAGREGDEAGDADDGPWFGLPADEYAQLMWDRRIATTAAEEDSAAAAAEPETEAKGRRRKTRHAVARPSESPPMFPGLLPKVGDPPPISIDADDADESRSAAPNTTAAAASPAASGGRATRARGGRGAARGGRSSRASTRAKAQSPEEESDEEESEGEEESSSSSGSGSEEEEEDEPAETKSGGRGAGRGGRKGTASTRGKSTGRRKR